MIAIIEEDEDYQFLLLEELRVIGWEGDALFFTNVNTLVEYWKVQGVRSIPLLILLDAFSRTNNLKASIESLKSIHELAAVPIIMMIGSEHEKDYFRSRSLDVSGYIVKPVSGQQLQQYLGLE